MSSLTRPLTFRKHANRPLIDSNRESSSPSDLEDITFIPEGWYEDVPYFYIIDSNYVYGEDYIRGLWGGFELIDKQE